MKKLLLSLLISLGFASILQAQIIRYNKINLLEEPNVSQLIIEQKPNLQGYRIHVFTGNANEREKAQKIKEFIENTFDVKAYVDYESPLFKVRVGDFPSKIEAVSFKYQLKEHYKNAYIIPVKEINL